MVISGTTFPGSADYSETYGLAEREVAFLPLDYIVHGIYHGHSKIESKSTSRGGETQHVVMASLVIHASPLIGPIFCVEADHCAAKRQVWFRRGQAKDTCGESPSVPPRENSKNGKHYGLGRLVLMFTPIQNKSSENCPVIFIYMNTQIPRHLVSHKRLKKLRWKKHLVRIPFRYYCKINIGNFKMPQNALKTDKTVIFMEILKTLQRSQRKM